MPVRLFVGNLPYNATEAELREHFSAVGPVSYFSIPTDRETGQPRGFAFIEFNDRAHAEEAVRRFNNQLFKGRPIAVSEARAREARPPGSVSSRPSSSRPNAPRLGLSAEPDVASPPATGTKRSRDFGANASPQAYRNKGKDGARQERAQKGPMREMVRGQFFGEHDADDDYDDVEDDFDDVDDFYDDADDLQEKESADDLNEKESTNENFAHHLSDAKSEENN